MSLILLNMRKSMYFINNFPPNFIKEAWSNNPLLAQHLEEKLLRFIEEEGRGFVNANVFLKFFSNLDGANQEILCKYIAKNYNGIS